MVSALRRYWALALLVTILTMAVVTSALALAPREYTATAVVAMAPRPEARISADVLRLTIPTYAALADSQRLATDLAARFREDANDIRASISVANPPSSNTILLSVSWSDPAVAARMANGLADEVLEAAATDPLLTSSLVAEAVAPTVASWPPRRAGLVLGMLISLALGAAAAVLADRRRPLVSSLGQVVSWVEEQHPGVPVLASGELATGTASFVARAVEDRVASYGGGGALEIEIVDAGEPSPAGVAVAAGVAAALARRGRRILLCLTERDRAFLGAPEVARELTSLATGQVLIGSIVPGEGRAPESSGPVDEDDPDGVDVIVRLLRGTLHLREWNAPKSLVGVLALVMPGEESDRVRGSLRAVAAAELPLLAVCYLVSAPTPATTQS